MPKLLTSESPRINCWIKFSHAYTDLQTVEPLNAERCLPRNEWFPRGELVIDYKCGTRHFTGSWYEDAAFFPLLQTPDFCFPLPGFLPVFLPVKHFHNFFLHFGEEKTCSVMLCPVSDRWTEKRRRGRRTLKRRKGRFATSASSFSLSITGVARASVTIARLTNVGPEMILFSFFKTHQNAENNVSERPSHPPQFWGLDFYQGLDFPSLSCLAPNSE